MSLDRQSHWENIYQTKSLETLGWYQPKPETSLSLIGELKLNSSDAIIDIGGGDSLLADHLLATGHTDLTILDISAAAIERAKARIGANWHEKINWVVSDITTFQSKTTYKLWHDRATFHFLTEKDDQIRYKEIVSSTVRDQGYFIIGTFSEKGPKKCSGIPIKQYSVEQLQLFFKDSFNMIKGFNSEHYTPNKIMQHYTFCVFQKKT